MTDFTTKGDTVLETSAKKFLDLVDEGAKPADAAEVLHVSLATLKTSGALGKAVSERLKRAKTEKLLAKGTEEDVARVRRLELMLQDEDLKVAATMVKSTLDTGAKVAVQINNNALLADPAVRESLKSLQIDIETEEPNDSVSE
jgi:hypothetical protein